MINAHNDGASVNAHIDRQCAVLSNHNGGNANVDAHVGDAKMTLPSHAQFFGENDAMFRNRVFDGVGIQEKASVPSEPPTKLLNSKALALLGSCHLGNREDESAQQDTSCVRIGEKTEIDNTNAADVKIAALSSEGSLPAAQLQENFQKREDSDAVFGCATVGGGLSAKPLTSEPMPLGSPASGPRDNESDVQNANSRLHSEPIALGASSAIGAVGGKIVGKDAGAHFGEDGTNISIQLEIVTDENEEEENICEPPSATTRSVRFASTNKVRQFDSYCAVSTLLHEIEGHVELQNNAGKELRRRKRAQNTKVNMETTTSVDNKNVCISQHSLFGIVGSPKNVLTHQPVEKKAIQIVLLHSHSHTQILHQAMQYIHQDRDILLESLMKWCGILHGANAGGALSSFLTILPPKLGTRKLLEKFHDREYLDLLQFPPKKSLNGSVKDNGDNTDKHCEKSMKDKQTSNCSGDSARIDSSEEETSLLFEEPYSQLPNDEILSKYGLEDDCPFPESAQSHSLLWKYCLAVSGASWHAASLLTATESKDETDVAIHWGGGRHHAHANKAGGFCYVSDVVLAIHRLSLCHDSQIDVGMLEDRNYGTNIVSIQRNLSFRRVLYIDVDIHHADAVQAAFYSTDRVLTASFHRFSPGFFPASSGSINEKGEVGTSGLGYNLNVPLPAGIGDAQFIQIYRKALFGLVKAYDPHAIVLCVGADGLEGDELVSGSLGGVDKTGEGWTLSPEGLAECVRIAAALCAGWHEDDICVSHGFHVDHTSSTHCVTKEKPKRGNRRKLLIFGGGGYTPAQTARTYLLCSAAACEGARPGMLWSELPRDIPSHDYFPRYGPMFELVSEQKKTQILTSYFPPNTALSSDRDRIDDGIETYHEVTASEQQVLKEANRAIELATLYIDRQQEKKSPQKCTFCFDDVMKHDEEMLDGSQRRKKNANSRGGRRRKKKKTETDLSQHSETTSL